MTHEISLSKAHLGIACKYAGISFIAGAVNHGFFSGHRSLITAALGLIAFAIGNLIERKQDNSGNFVSEVLLGSIFSIGLGFFTGGLQHFPDSPHRSVWVVPLGFALSMCSLIAMRKNKPNRSEMIYVLISNLVVVTACVLALNFLGSSARQDHHYGSPQEAQHDHHSEEADHHSQDTIHHSEETNHNSEEADHHH